MDQDKGPAKGARVAAIVFLVLGVLANVSFFFLVLVFGFGTVRAFTPDHFRLYAQILSLMPGALVSVLMPFIVSIMLFSFQKKKKSWWFVLIAALLTLGVVSAAGSFLYFYQACMISHMPPPAAAVSLTSLVFIVNLAGLYGLFGQRKWARIFLMIYFAGSIVLTLYGFIRVLLLFGISKIGPHALVGFAVQVALFGLALYGLIGSRGRDLFTVAEELPPGIASEG